jgi:three-Cys-motif partner protein
MVYIDAFAGTGYRETSSTSSGAWLIPELLEEPTQRFLDGSAIRMLSLQPGFHRYVFIEKSREKLAELESNVRARCSSRLDACTFIPGDCNAALREICQGWKPHQRAVLFLDPYGMQVGWDTMRLVAETRSMDVIALFPLSTVNRLLRCDGNIPKPWRNALNRLFGTSEWYEAFYDMHVERVLHGTQRQVTKTATWEKVAEFYSQCLRDIFAGVIDNPPIIQTPDGHPLFQLWVAAANPRGAPILRRIAESVCSMQTDESPSKSQRKLPWPEELE